MYTPWGDAQTTKLLSPGIISVDTSSHGGVHVEKELNKLIPVYMRASDGWYEEDVDWAIVATVFPHAFTAAEREQAKNTLRGYVPMAYELFYKEVIPPGESHRKDESAFKALHKNDYLTLAAFGSNHPGIKFDIPEGQVLVFAGRGGRTETHQYPKDTAYFLVPDAEYSDPHPFSFVIDESRHPRVDIKD